MLSFPWIANVPPAKVKEELSLRLLMMFVVGAPDWLKSSLSPPPRTDVPPVYVLLPVSVRRPVPVCVRLPLPLTTPL